MDFLGIGETMVALVPEAASPLRYAQNFRMKIAGAESNTAIGLCKLGHTAGWISRLGEDEFGHYVRNTLRGEGVDTSCVRWSGEHRTGVMFKETGMGETRVYYYRENSAASHLSPEDLPYDALREARITLTSGITAVLSESCRRSVDAAFDIMASAPGDICFDPNIRKKLWQGQDFAPLIRKYCERADILLLGREEGALLFGEEEADALLDILLESTNAHTIALKDGAGGAYAATRQERCFIPPVPCRVVDPIGAGDAFNAAFLSGLLKGLPLAECGRRGGFAGAWATGTIGDYEGYPSSEQLEAYMRNEETTAR